MRRRTDEGTAPDLTAEVFTRAWRKRSDLWRAKTPLAWLYGISRNVVLEFYRSRGHDQEAMQALEHNVVQHADKNDAVDQALDIAAALKTMHEKDREILLLSAWEDLEGADLGAVLGVSAGAARVRLHRARARLTKTLNEALTEQHHKQRKEQ
ncbi:RNA polymerase sigma factor [Corynebacterium hindlerae]|uniref:RNA polymerase sigma factor n=2 Tax=Corynebacterium hindlerae TaxID=699041 RepID=A0A7G5FIW3_9CORY|nr:RNA polymerase sigma factor [Corynebacterium hindlerae]